MYWSFSRKTNRHCLGTFKDGEIFYCSTPNAVSLTTSPFYLPQLRIITFHIFPYYPYIFGESRSDSND
jgi:hypothetical protein